MPSWTAFITSAPGLRSGPLRPGLSSAALAVSRDFPAGQNWTHYVRIGAYGLQKNDADKIVRDATASNVFGIEVDNDIPGRYESFLDPRKIEGHSRGRREGAPGGQSRVRLHRGHGVHHGARRTRRRTRWRRSIRTGCSGKLRASRRSLAAAPRSGSRKGDEDVWISPYATEWRKIYMERVRQIAATGIDGIYVDIPYWMTHFDGWEDTWASFDDLHGGGVPEEDRAGREARSEDSETSPTRISASGWTFGFRPFTDFLREIDVTAKSVNPEIKTIPEIYPGIEEEAVRVGLGRLQLVSGRRRDCARV